MNNGKVERETDKGLLRVPVTLRFKFKQLKGIILKDMQREIKIMTRF